MLASYQSILDRMSVDLGLIPSHLNHVIRTAPLRYKSFAIKKRDGSDRRVAQPAKEVKAIQRWLIANLLCELPVHDAATAYRPGRSIRTNAERHARSNYMLKVDFTHFFPSIKKPDIKYHLSRHLGATLLPDAIEMVTHCLTWAPTRRAELQLCIGAPSSPLVSNSIMYDFDTAVSNYCNGVISYTRYADDLTFSCSEKGLLDAVLDFVRTELANLQSPQITVNEDKTVFASRRSRRTVTGIFLTPDHKLSVGRKRKREVRAMYHRHCLGLLTPEEEERLKGLLAFIEHIEPGFETRLRASSKRNDSSA